MLASRGRTRLVIVATLLAILPGSLAEAGRVTFRMARIGPSDLWCPLTLTTGEGEDGFENSSMTELNLGRFEASFTAPADGRVILILEASDPPSGQPLRVDNMMVVERVRLFDPNQRLVSGECYKGSEDFFPDALTPLIPSNGPPWAFLQKFERSLPKLESRGWSFTNATVDHSQSATESVVIDSDITVVCDDVDPGNCGSKKGSLLLSPASGVPAQVHIPVEDLESGVAYAVVLWWNFQPGDELQIDVFDPETLFTDGFESGDVSAWTDAVGRVVPLPGSGEPSYSTPTRTNGAQ